MILGKTRAGCVPKPQQNDSVQRVVGLCKRAGHRVLPRVQGHGPVQTPRWAWGMSRVLNCPESNVTSGVMANGDLWNLPAFYSISSAAQCPESGRDGYLPLSQ